MAATDKRLAQGLRERKKAKARTLIQRQALRLFREHGYEATTIRQIAEAAEISESTFFRYFPSKEDLVRWDEFDPLILESFRAQPAMITPIAALRGAIREVLTRLTSEERAELRQRVILGLSLPHAMGPDQFNGPLGLLAEAVAQRVGQTSTDFGVRMFIGAVLGVGNAVILETAEHPEADVITLLDEALAQFEAGFPMYT